MLCSRCNSFVTSSSPSYEINETMITKFGALYKQRLAPSASDHKHSRFPSTFRHNFRSQVIFLALTTCLLAVFGIGEEESSKRNRSAEPTSWAVQTMRTLSLEEKVGQMLQVRYFADYDNFEAADYKQLRSEIQQYHVGSLALGLHMRGANLVRISPIQAARVANQIQTDSKLPLLIGADFERGLASRLVGVPGFPFPMAFGATANTQAAYDLGKMTATEARALGFQWAFAPVADVNTNPLNPIINDRSFGDDPKAVGAFVAAFVDGAHAGGLMVTAKHFPGHGGASSDSHKGIPTITGDLQNLQRVEFEPFRQAIRAGVDAVLIEHARVPALDPDPLHVATTSATVINGTLKTKLGFNGLVITDALEMRGLMQLYASRCQSPTACAAVDAVKAGNDVIALPEDLDAAFHAIVNAVRSGEIPEKRIDESVLKILQAKESLGLDKHRIVNLDGIDPTMNAAGADRFAQEVADRAMTLVRDSGRVLPLNETEVHSAEHNGAGAPVFVVFKSSLSSDSGDAFAAAVKQRIPAAQVFLIDQTNAKGISSSLISAVQNANKVIIATATSHTAIRERVLNGVAVTSFGLLGPSEALMHILMSVASEKIAVVAIGNPYVIESFPEIQTYLCTYSLSPNSELSAVKAIFGDIQPTGKLPIVLAGIADRGSSLSWKHSDDVQRTQTAVSFLSRPKPAKNSSQNPVN